MGYRKTKSKGKKFTKHSGLRGAIHKELVKSGQLTIASGKTFDRLFESRQAADYVELSEFEVDQVKLMFNEATAFVNEMEKLLNSENS